MVNIDQGESQPSDLDRIARSPEVSREGWIQTVEDVQAMMADRENEGYETLFLPSGHTTPKNPESGETEEWGLSYIVPGNKVDPFIEFNERANFSETAVYQSTAGENVFIVTECIDPEAKLSLFIGGAYRIRFSPPMVRTAMEEGKMYSHLKRLDGTLIHTFEHEHPESFFPDPDQFYAYETDI
ncbi:hypothetical protein [Haloferax sp. DFSO52]|uniref:DUF7529 family protein n=1 Tax=Haloferax sp. DFSO52 TaxID=3388505 RepID=UPI003A8979F7